MSTRGRAILGLLTYPDFAHPGIDLVRAGRFADAIRAFDRSLSQDGPCPRVLGCRAVARALAGDADGAVSDLTAAIRLDPAGLADYLHNRGYLYFERGEYGPALADYTRAVELAPEDAAGYAGRAAVLAATARPEDAVAEYGAAIRLAPGRADLYAGRGLLRWQLGDTRAALGDLRRAIDADPGNAEYHSLRGRVREQAGDLDSALRDHEAAVRLAPASATVLNNRGHARALAGDFRGAVADYEAALACDPDHPNPHKNLAHVLATCPDRSLRDGRRAVAHALRAVELTGHARPEWFTIVAAAYREAGDGVRAGEWASRAPRPGPT